MRVTHPRAYFGTFSFQDVSSKSRNAVHILKEFDLIFRPVQTSQVHSFSYFFIAMQRMMFFYNPVLCSCETITNLLTWYFRYIWHKLETNSKINTNACKFHLTQNSHFRRKNFTTNFQLEPQKTIVQCEEPWGLTEQIISDRRVKHFYWN